MMDGEQPAVLGRMDDVAARNRRQAQVAAHQMQVIARQQNDLAGPDHEALFFTLDPDVKVALDDVVINNQMGRWPESGRAMLGRDARRMHHGAKNSACRNTPPVKCATLKTSDNASIPASYQDPVFRSCLPVGRS